MVGDIRYVLDNDTNADKSENKRFSDNVKWLMFY